MEDLVKDKENIRLEKGAIGIPFSPSSVNMSFMTRLVDCNVIVILIV